MGSGTTEKAYEDWAQVARPQAFSEPEQVLAAYFSSATVGLAICDTKLRFQAINHTLAAMNGLPAEAHLGKTVRAIL
jgi:PAS domain-containing protein